MKIDKRIVLGLIFIVVIVGSAFLLEHTVKVQGSNSARIIPVIQNNETIAFVDAGVIEQLREQEHAMREVSEGSDNTGEVSLEFVLGSVGGFDYRYIEVKGLDDSETWRLEQSKLDPAIVLSSNMSGTVAMINSEDGRQILIKAIKEIHLIK